MPMLFSPPPWLASLNATAKRFRDDRQAMAFAIAAGAANIRHGGGPFGAVVVDAGMNLVATGVNLVIPLHCSVLHAEMVAIILAQQRLGTHNLAAAGAVTLYTSCEPCAMCFGALPFAGIKRLVCAASTADAEALGFDEGAKPSRWRQALQQRGIAVAHNICRAEARTLFADYGARNGEMY